MPFLFEKSQLLPQAQLGEYLRSAIDFERKRRACIVRSTSNWTSLAAARLEDCRCSPVALVREARVFPDSVLPCHVPYGEKQSAGLFFDPTLVGEPSPRPERPKGPDKRGVLSYRLRRWQELHLVEVY